MIKEIVSMDLDEAEYEINGVKYIVSSRFTKPDTPLSLDNTINERVKKYIGSDFADLNITQNDVIIDEEYAHPTAGKED